MPNSLANYSPQRCRTLLSRLAVPLGVLVALVAAAAWLTPTALEINSSRWPTVVTLVILVIGVTVWFGPFMVNLLVGSLRPTSFLRTDGPWLLIGSPFTRRIRLTDIATVATRHAEGDIFEVIIDVQRVGGATMSFLADVADRDVDDLAAEIRNQADRPQHS